MKKILRILSIVGPGMFAIGHMLGTGSVTSMAKAGADYGLGLLWVLFLSCLLSGFLMAAYGRFALVSGETSFHAISRHLPGGKALAFFILLGVVIAQSTCLGGILTLSSGAFIEAFGLKCGVLPVSCVLIGVMYALLMIGRYSFFEKVLAAFVLLMAFTFIVSVFVTWPDGATLAKAAKPMLPTSGDSLIMLTAFVGTTVAAQTFLMRPLLLKEKGMTLANMKEERIDAWSSSAITFVISAAIMMVATGALYAHGKGIDKVLDMAGTLQPIAGKAAVVLFMTGTLAAGCSSIFPILMVAPVLISDWKDGTMGAKSKMFRILAFGMAAWGLLLPSLGGNPIAVTVMAQISNCFALPLTAVAIVLLMNNRKLMGDKKAGPFLNTLLVVAMLVSFAIASTAVKALYERFFG